MNFEIDQKFIDKHIRNPSIYFSSMNDIKFNIQQTLKSFSPDIEKISEKLDIEQFYSFVEKIFKKEIPELKAYFIDDTIEQLHKEINLKANLIGKKRKKIDVEEITSSESDEKQNTIQKIKKNKKKSQKEDKFFDLKEFQNIGEEGLRPEDYVKQENDSNEEEIEEEDINTQNLKFNDFYEKGENAEDEEIDNNSENEEIRNPDQENDIFNLEDKYLNADENEKKKIINQNLDTMIESIEQKMMEKKPWQLKGEARAKDRKKESLLEEVVEYQVTMKPPPVPTTTYTEEIEILIKQRVKDDLFDNPIKKSKEIKDVNSNFEIKFNKDKRGLGQIYEEQYENNNNNVDSKEAEQIKTEIQVIEDKLFKVLDRLTNFNFIPNVNKEINIIKNVPSILLEDISANVTDRKTFTQTPKEQYNKKDIHLQDRNEMKKEEKQSSHNKIKRKIRSHLIKKKNSQKLKELYNKTSSKFESKLIMKKDKDKEKNTSKKGDFKSGKFFNNLQNVLKEEIKNNKNN